MLIKYALSLWYELIVTLNFIFMIEAIIIIGGLYACYRLFRKDGDKFLEL